MPNITATEIDYEKATFKHGTYKYINRLPDIASDIIITSARAAPTLYTIPTSDVYNYSKTSLFGTLTIPALADNYTAMHVNGVSMIESISLVANNGTRVVDLPFANIYSNMTLRRNKKFKDVKTWDKLDDEASKGIFYGLLPINNDKIEYTAQTVEGAIVGVVPQLIHARPTSLSTGGPSTINTPYDECRYIIQSEVNTDLVLKFDIPLSNIVHNNIFGVDKDVYFYKYYVQLAIKWAPTSSFAWLLYSNTSVVSAAPNITISNLQLRLAVETNTKIISDLSNDITAGRFEMYIPYIVPNTIPLSGTNHSFVTTLTNTSSLRLLKSYTAAYSQTNTYQNAFDHANCNYIAATDTYTFRTRISQYETLLDSNKINDFVIDVECGDDYQISRNRERGNCILSSGEFYYNNTFIDDFTDNNTFVEKLFPKDQSTYQDGVMLEGCRLYTLKARLPNSLNLTYYNFSVLQRKLKITLASVEFNDDLTHDIVVN